MKKALLVFFSLLSLSIYAQRDNQLEIGLGGAYNAVLITQQNFYGETEIDYAMPPKFGYVGNLALGYGISDNFSVNAEFQYSIQGIKYGQDNSQNGDFYLAPDTDQVNQSFEDPSREITLSYFNIPVLAKFSFGRPANNTKFRLMLGPQFGFLLDAQQDYLRNGAQVETFVKDLDGQWFDVTSADITDRYENLDVGIVFDMGVDVYATHYFMINVGLRVNYGLMDINAEPYRLPSRDGDPYTASHNAFGGIYLGLNYLLDTK